MARILLIDDDDDYRTMLGRALTHFGHNVIEAFDGKQGLDLFPQVNADLVITDIVMPEKEGLEVLMELKKHPTPVKVIVISGGFRNRHEGYLRTAKLLGAALVFEKPFPIVDLITAINELLSDGKETSAYQ